MDGWTGGRVDWWTGGRVDGWTGGRVDGWTVRTARLQTAIENLAQKLPALGSSNAKRRLEADSREL